MSKPVVVVLLIVTGVVAYVLGAKAGRTRYREISRAAKQLWDDPALQKARKRSRKAIEKAADRAASKIGR